MIARPAHAATLLAVSRTHEPGKDAWWSKESRPRSRRPVKMHWACLVTIRPLGPNQLCRKHKRGNGIQVVDGTSSVPKEPRTLRKTLTIVRIYSPPPTLSAKHNKATATATQLISWSQAQHRLSWGANSPTLHKELYKRRLLRCGTKSRACSALRMIAAHQREGLPTTLDCTTPTQVSRQLLTTHYSCFHTG